MVPGEMHGHRDSDRLIVQVFASVRGGKATEEGTMNRGLFGRRNAENCHIAGGDGLHYTIKRSLGRRSADAGFLEDRAQWPMPRSSIVDRWAAGRDRDFRIRRAQMYIAEKTGKIRAARAAQEIRSRAMG